MLAPGGDQCRGGRPVQWMSACVFWWPVPRPPREQLREHARVAGPGPPEHQPRRRTPHAVGRPHGLGCASPARLPLRRSRLSLRRCPHHPRGHQRSRPRPPHPPRPRTPSRRARRGGRRRRAANKPLSTMGRAVRRTFLLDVLACPRCDGPMRLLARVTEPKSVPRDLRALGEPTQAPARAPARGPPFWMSRVLRGAVLGDEAAE